MIQQATWKFGLDGTPHTVTLSHDVSDGSGYLAIDGLLRRGFGPASIPVGGDLRFEVEGRQCYIRIVPLSGGSHSCVCVVGNSVIEQSHSESSLQMTLVRPALNPEAPAEILVRAAFPTCDNNDDLVRPTNSDEITSVVMEHEP